MANKSPHPKKHTSAQGSKSQFSTLTHTPEREKTYHPKMGQEFEVT